MPVKLPTHKISGLDNRVAAFAANCIAVCDLLPRGKAGASNFKDQLARSATSVAANYAEASVPSSRRDFVGRLTIALKELAESRMHLNIISRLNYPQTLTPETIGALISEADSIATTLKEALSTRKTRNKREKTAVSPAKRPPIAIVPATLPPLLPFLPAPQPVATGS